MGLSLLKGTEVESEDGGEKGWRPFGSKGEGERGDEGDLGEEGGEIMDPSGSKEIGSEN